MDRADLFELWQANKHRPTFVLEHRDQLAEHIDTSEPIPTSGTFAIRQWLEAYMGVVTKQLAPDTEDADEESDDE